MEEVYLTKEGYQKLLEELEYLKTVKRKELSKAIAEARAHGDISENAEYDAAKEAQALNEKRIAQLEEKLSCARIIDDKQMPKDEVAIGATVRLKDLDSAEELEYTLVSEVEASSIIFTESTSTVSPIYFFKNLINLSLKINSILVFVLTIVILNLLTFILIYYIFYDNIKLNH